MSKTNKTRPYDIQENDRRVARYSNSHGDVTLIIGGLGGMKGHGKIARKADARERRRRDRLIGHNAKYSPETEADTVQPRRIRADRKSIRDK